MNHEREKDKKYNAIKGELFRLIYFGILEDGMCLPTERVLSELYNVSRETVRKALISLKEDGLIESRQGSGNYVRLRERAYANDLDSIVLVAPADRRYFSEFLKHFQNTATAHGAKVLFYHYSGDCVEDVLFDLLLRGVHNIVLWASAYDIDSKLMMRLRCMGLNCVLFDGSEGVSYGDAVFIDNDDGVQKAYEYASGKCRNRKIGFIGWDDMSLPSAARREKKFIQLNGASNIWHLPWRKNADVDFFAEIFMKFFVSNMGSVGSLICSDADIGLAIHKALVKYAVSDLSIVVVDDMDEYAALGITGYVHRLLALAEQAYKCLDDQSRRSENWRPAVFPIQGDLIIRD